MSIQSKRRGTCLLSVLMSAIVVCGQTVNNASVHGSPLGQHYDDAQKLQRAGKLNEAAEQYRAFLAAALGQLAIGYGVATEYTHAAPLFDEALTLVPNSPSLLLDYAQIALALGDPEHAKTLAAEIIRKYPDDREKLAQSHQVLGRALLKQDRDPEARNELETAVGLDPTFPNGYDLAVACLDLGDEKCAVRIFDELQRSFGDTPEIHMAFGRAYSESDFQPRAVAEFKQAIQENPRLPGAHYLLAAVLLTTGGDEQQVTAAETELKKELIISPNDSMAYAALGRIATSRGNYDEAEAYLKKAISLAPLDPDAFLLLGQMYIATKRSAEAETALRKCIRLTVDVSQNRYQVRKAHYLLGRILMQNGQNDEARAQMDIASELLNKSLAKDQTKLAALMGTSEDSSLQAASGGSAISPPLAETPADVSALRKVEALREQIKYPVADSYNNLGAISATNNDYSNAITYFERAALWNPSLEGLDYNWGRAAFAGSQFAEAILPLSRYVKSHPDDLGARSVLALSHFMSGNYHGCIETLQSVIGKADLVPQVEYVYAESMIRTGQVGAGTQRLQALEKSHPEIPDVHRSLGEAWAQQGERQKALEELRAAIQLSPRDADSHYALGTMELKSGDTAAAIPELEAAVGLSPASVQFHQELADAYTAALRTVDAQKQVEICRVLESQMHRSASSSQAASSPSVNP